MALLPADRVHAVEIQEYYSCGAFEVYNGIYTKLAPQIYFPGTVRNMMGTHKFFPAISSPKGTKEATIYYEDLNGCFRFHIMYMYGDLP
ncbi:Aspartyl/glutamyl-tRNA(Asn/Gln) amidotransferase subunit B [Frankliniella fusca]|uniref:Aspartyl/glutamyl-tRNA(Asn/Gln) amidotransferase subunit B n=1 Tax=Frankliniella fusca TaxID=407009 RepID=A0AAE1I2A2_9NEOP|nr:Aspartyl/glutamyl-tRNA(Asn/Gln) amidotransferase subunit B [Frankliniella fusca]